MSNASKLLRLAKSSVAYGFYADDNGKYASVLDTNHRGSDWYHRVIIRPQSDGTYLLEMFNHFEHSSAGDICIWGNSVRGEMSKPWWEVTKIASVKIRSLNKCTREEDEKIKDELFVHANGCFWSSLDKGISELRCGR